MSESAKGKTEKQAIEQIRLHSEQLNAAVLGAALMNGDVTALAQSITMLESTNTVHQEIASAIVQNCLPQSGNSLRLGITGVPGVGKSTFIDAFGMHLIAEGRKVAVLAIDPTSPISKGSILGDKTRMDQLAADAQAFIRPSPAAETLGGVARKTRETIILCEAAGFDIIIVETVGVGQSEIAVHRMTDFFLLLMLAGAGDQLQGIKRGIMEMCDAMLITKADGENIKSANFARAEYTSSLHLFPAKESGWIAPVITTSAIEKKGLKETWELISKHEQWMKERNLFHAHRQFQDVQWMHDTIKDALITDFYSSDENMSRIESVESDLKEGKITAFEAAKIVLGKR